MSCKDIVGLLTCCCSMINRFRSPSLIAQLKVRVGSERVSAIACTRDPALIFHAVVERYAHNLDWYFSFDYNVERWTKLALECKPKVFADIFSGPRWEWEICSHRIDLITTPQNVRELSMSAANKPSQRRSLFHLPQELRDAMFWDSPGGIVCLSMICDGEESERR